MKVKLVHGIRLLKIFIAPSRPLYELKLKPYSPAYTYVCFYKGGFALALQILKNRVSVVATLNNLTEEFLISWERVWLVFLY